MRRFISDQGPNKTLNGSLHAVIVKYPRDTRSLTSKSLYPHYGQCFFPMSRYFPPNSGSTNGSLYPKSKFKQALSHSSHMSSAPLLLLAQARLSSPSITSVRSFFIEEILAIPQSRFDTAVSSSHALKMVFNSTGLSLNLRACFSGNSLYSRIYTNFLMFIVDKIAAPRVCRRMKLKSRTRPQILSIPNFVKASPSFRL